MMGTKKPPHEWLQVRNKERYYLVGDDLMDRASLAISVPLMETIASITLPVLTGSKVIKILAVCCTVLNPCFLKSLATFFRAYVKGKLSPGAWFLWKLD